ncbi:MAG: hypothetical protein OHK0039_38810 [Bacteroidia bacterium]
MKTPKISIVTPSFNQGPYIEDAIRSVLDQGYPNIEHIIIDNCSTDQTAEIASRYPHVVFVSEPDEGQSDAINKGFLRATGDIIGWLNADDYYLPGTFGKVQQIMALPGVDGLYSNVRFIDKEGAFTRNLISHKVVRWLSLFHCYIPSTTFFFRREIIDRGLLIDKEMHISMDKDFFAKILYNGYKLQYVNDFFAAFRWHDSNKSLDTREVQNIRHKEGLIIFNRYSGRSYTVNDANVKIYREVERMLLVLRRLLKLQNGRYNYPNLV